MIGGMNYSATEIKEDAMSEFTYKGKTHHTVGNLPETGQKAPEFILTGTDFEDVSLSDLSGKKIILNIFPSIETPVCAESVRRFNSVVDQLDNTVILCISKDLPFAHNRFNLEEGVDSVYSLSELRDMDFGERFGVRIADGPLAGLLSRAVVVIDENGRVVYTQQVPRLEEEPDYETALQMLRTAGPDTTIDQICERAFDSRNFRPMESDDACDDGRSGKI